MYWVDQERNHEVVVAFTAATQVHDNPKFLRTRARTAPPGDRTTGG